MGRLGCYAVVGLRLFAGGLAELVRNYGVAA